MDDDEALFRYRAISAYLALEPPRGQRTALLQQLAARSWPGPDGHPRRVAAETLRAWCRRYRKGGLEALRDKPRPRPGIDALTEEQQQAVLALKRAVPERSLDRLIHIAEATEVVPPGVLKRTTVHRLLRQHHVAARRPAAQSSRKDLDRWEAAFPNDLWQSDLLAGPWLPDPDRPGKMKRPWLCAFLDDHSRLLLHGRFDWLQGLPALELVFKRALQKYGVPRRVYFDNGKVYRSAHMARICGHLGVHRVVFTQVRRPEGHGKIEAFNRFVRSAFLPELAVGGVRTLAELNEAFVAWADLDYNRRCHGETQQEPLARWKSASDAARYATDEELRVAFLLRERRTPDKAGVFSLGGTQYQVGPKLSKRRVEVRYDPDHLDEVEVWLDDVLAERARPRQTHQDRRPHPARKAPTPASEVAATGATVPTVDYLQHLVERRRDELGQEPSPRAIAEAARLRREAMDDAVVAVLADRLDADAFDATEARDWLRRFGPLDPDGVASWLDATLHFSGTRDRHATHYLQEARAALLGPTP